MHYTIGRNIKNIRLEKNLKQYELAYKSNISNTYLSDIENGRSIPSIKTLMNLAKVLEVDCCSLLYPHIDNIQTKKS